MPGTVLLVEDEADVREAVRDVLEYEGFRVLEAAHGQAALELLRADPSPRLVLLDLMMPVMNGFLFLEALRGEPALTDLPVVILSAADRATTERAMKDTHAKACLTKPVQLAPLVEAVTRFCHDAPVV